MKVILLESLQKYRTAEYWIHDLAKEPRHMAEGWASPEGETLTMLPVQWGWHRVYLAKKQKQFWIMEIEGPDHGVHFYGPVPESEMPEAKET